MMVLTMEIGSTNNKRMEVKKMGQMKIRQEHYEHIEIEIQKVISTHKGNLVEEYETGRFPRSLKVKDLQKRFCWDLFYAARLTQFTVNVLYPDGCHDEHIYTTLKKICPVVTRRY